MSSVRPRWTWITICVILGGINLSFGDDDPPNPFGSTQAERTDAIYGAITLSNGTVIRGKIYLTRGQQLRIYDSTKEQNRDVALKSVREIRCHVDKEWMEAEWRFKENANDEKVLTGRKYPSRMYSHEIMLSRGGSIKGPLAAIVYIEPESTENSSDKPKSDAKADTENEKKRDAKDGPKTQKAQKSDDKQTHQDESQPGKPVRYLLHKRDKGELDQTLKDLVYVEKIVFGEDARKAAKATNDKSVKEER